MELFLEGGSEFTAIVLDVGSGFDCHPVVLLPTEVFFFFPTCSHYFPRIYPNFGLILLWMSRNIR